MSLFILYAFHAVLPSKVGILRDSNHRERVDEQGVLTWEPQNVMTSTKMLRRAWGRLATVGDGRRWLATLGDAKGRRQRRTLSNAEEFCKMLKESAI